MHYLKSCSQNEIVLYISGLHNNVSCLSALSLNLTLLRDLSLYSSVFPKPMSSLTICLTDSVRCRHRVRGSLSSTHRIAFGFCVRTSALTLWMHSSAIYESTTAPNRKINLQKVIHQESLSITINMIIRVLNYSCLKTPK